MQDHNLIVIRVTRTSTQLTFEIAFIRHDRNTRLSFDLSLKSPSDAGTESCRTDLQKNMRTLKCVVTEIT